MTCRVMPLKTHPFVVPDGRSSQRKTRRLSPLLVVILLAGASFCMSSDWSGGNIRSASAKPVYNQWYVAPNGTSGGSGTIDNPWNLQTALDHPASVHPGDTIWLRGGTYGTGGSTYYQCELAGTQEGPITLRQYPGERAIVNGGIEAHGPWVTFWGFEITNTSTDRSVPREGRPNGLSLQDRGQKVINMNIHDTGHPGISFWSPVGDGGEIYGTLIWHNGLYENGSLIKGSAIYAQNQNGTRYIDDNIMFRNFTTGGKAYTEGAYADGFNFDGNASFDNGEWNLFGSTMTTPMQRLRVIDNYTYRRPGDSIENVQFGYYSNTNNDAVFQNNYFVAGTDRATLYLKNWRTLTMSGNTLVSRSQVLSHVDRPSGATVTWNDNDYFTSNASPFELGGSELNFNNWRSQTGYDADSNYSTSQPTGVRVFVRPNRYEPGRANIVVYNWDLNPTVQVDVSDVLPVGTQYQVMDAQNFNGSPVASGTYSGGALTLPMNLTTVAPYIGTVTHRPPASHTAPEFAVFVLLPTSGAPVTPLPTSTATPPPPATATRTSTTLPANTATRTFTTLPANTATRTRTRTPAPIPTESATATHPPENTSTRTSTPIPTATLGTTGTPAPEATSTRTFTHVPTYTPPVRPSSTSTRTATPCGIDFSDVHPADYFYAAVETLYCMGAISGYSDNTFRPYNTTTRGQLCKIIVLAEEWNTNTSGGPHFTDVPPSNLFYEYIETAFNHDIIAGYTDGTFRWGNNITRGQLAKIVVEAEGWPTNTSGGPHFTDVPPNHPFYEYIETAYNHEVISGYTDGTFRPGGAANRGQIAKIVYNALSAH